MIFGRSVSLTVGATIIAAALLAPGRARAATAHDALVIGNGTYTTLPPISACLLSAHAVSAALRSAGFEIVEREDATSGATDAAIGEAGRSFAAAQGATAFVYVCAYATAYNDRTFLLPTSANIARAADVLSQGVLVRTLLQTVLRGNVQSAVIALDVVPAPQAPSPLGLDTILHGDLPNGLGAIAVSQAMPPDGPTPLAAALVANLKGSSVTTAGLLDAVQQQLAGNKEVTIAAIRLPDGLSYLVGAPPPAGTVAPAARAPAAQAPAAQGAPASAAQGAPPAQAAPGPATASASATLPATAPTASLPGEDQMTDADRRRVQTVLARLGYYDGQVDGVFGPDTRAAIRRYQHELHADMTGRLTAEQASKLAGGG